MFRIVKKIFFVLFVLVVGGIGGVVAERTLVPWLASREPFSRIPRLTVERVTVVQPKEEIIIDRSAGLERVVAAVRPGLVSVERRTLGGETLALVSGVAVTADGLVVTDEAVVGSSGIFSVRRNGENFDAVFVARDSRAGLALFRADRGNFPVVPFVEERDLALGETLFVLSMDQAIREPRLQTGYITGRVSRGIPETDLILDERTLGSPLYTFDGKLVGIAGQNATILPAGDIRALIERGD